MVGVFFFPRSKSDLGVMLSSGSFLNCGLGVGLPCSSRGWATDDNVNMLFNRALWLRRRFSRPLDLATGVPSMDKFLYLIFKVMTLLSVMFVTLVELAISRYSLGACRRELAESKEKVCDSARFGLVVSELGAWCRLGICLGAPKRTSGIKNVVKHYTVGKESKPFGSTRVHKVVHVGGRVDDARSSRAFRSGLAPALGIVLHKD
ncbi:hypothetical protein BHM03_00017703 [Ensete ventricosum]|nr:hypothetical protein BHM03_00017703 [Ensete ventricosum]